ncbi:MAG: GNAT family N-acetyltransferase [Hyphomonas sp.]
MDIWIRPFRPEYLDAIVAVNEAAFGGADEGHITRALHADGDSVLSLVATGNIEIVGHIEFFRVRIDRAPVGVGLGPMSVLPELQKTGVGARLIRLGLKALEGAGETLVFVLGHDTYYPKFGFSEAAAKPFAAPWSGPHFMALRLAPGGPETGTLTYPKAFGA